MEIQTATDINLVGRALSAGWLDGVADRRQQAVESLLRVVEEHPDPKMKVKAFSALVRADSADLKRAEVALRKQEADDNRRFRLLDLVKHLPAGTITEIASQHRAIAGDG